MVFVVIDGLDGSGKSTQAARTRSFLEGFGFTVYLRSHPSDDNLFGRKTRQYLYVEGRAAHMMSALFYLMDVMRSIIICPWRKYNVVIFVRYLMGTAYLPSPLHLIAYHFFAAVVPTSKLMFFLDVSPDVAKLRIRAERQREEVFESLSELKDVGKKALALAMIGGWIVLDANKPIKAVTERLTQRISEEILNHRTRRRLLCGGHA